jgi:hypothetical protein
MNLKTLVLDNAYQINGIYPMSGQQSTGCVIPVRQAFEKIYANSAYAIANYDVKIKTVGDHEFYWPSVIVLNGYYSNSNRKVILCKDNIFFRDNGVCQYCAEAVDRKEMTYDHIVPRARGGKHTWQNVCLSCRSCNLRKGSRPPKGEWANGKKYDRPTYAQLMNSRRNFPIKVHDPEWVQWIQPWHGEIILPASKKNDHQDIFEARL